LSKLGKSFSEAKTLKTMGASNFKFKVHGVNLLREYLFMPSIQLGPMTYGDGDVITPEAKIILNIRLVPGMDPIKTVDKIRNYLDKLEYADLQINILAQYPSSRTNLNSTVVQCLLETYKEFGVEPDIWPLLASATPYYLFSDILKLPYSSGGLGRAGKSHIANEFATVDGLKIFEKSIATFLYKFSKT
jgi:acetylornithine deacetylase/succinyl-diaminopimelate desuccinylase-like protein